MVNARCQTLTISTRQEHGRPSFPTPGHKNKESRVMGGVKNKEEKKNQHIPRSGIHRGNGVGRSERTLSAGFGLGKTVPSRSGI